MQQEVYNEKLALRRGRFVWATISLLTVSRYLFDMHNSGIFGFVCFSDFDIFMLLRFTFASGNFK